MTFNYRERSTLLIKLRKSSQFSCQRKGRKDIVRHFARNKVNGTQRDTDGSVPIYLNPFQMLIGFTTRRSIQKLDLVLQIVLRTNENRKGGGESILRLELTKRVFVICIPNAVSGVANCTVKCWQTTQNNLFCAVWWNSEEPQDNARSVSRK